MTKYDELKTIRDYIRFANTAFNEAALFYGHGTETAWDEAITLVLHTLHLSHDVLAPILDANLIATEKDKLLELIEKRIEKRIPLPYLTHEAWFFGLPFYVDERVLIPRSPIAELILKEFLPWRKESDLENILDLCTGSGCIAIACAKAFPDAQVDASDISKEALEVARMNVLRHHVDDQVKLYESDLFEKLPAKKYDIIVSNPPYVSLEEMESLPAEYLHEPRLGLAAEKEGLDFVLRILKKANEYLTPDGILIVEVGNSEYALMDKFPEIPFTWLEFERGGGGVFLLRATDLKENQAIFNE